MLYNLYCCFLQMCTAMDGWSILAVRSWGVAVSSSLIFVYGFCILCRWRTVEFSWYFSVLPIDSHGETCHTSSCQYRHIIEIDVLSQLLLNQTLAIIVIHTSRNFFPGVGDRRLRAATIIITAGGGRTKIRRTNQLT